VRLRLVLPRRGGRGSLGRLAALALAASAAFVAAGCGGDDESSKSPAPTIPPAEVEQPAPEPGLATGLVEPNANLLWSREARPDAPAGFGPWRDRVEALRPAYYRLVIDWAKLQPDPDRPPALDAQVDGCMRGKPPCAPYPGVKEVLEAVRSQQKAHGGWEVSVLVYGTPEWAAHRPRGCERSNATGFSRPITDRGLKAYRELVSSLIDVGHDAGVELRYWSPWNEPNHPAFISPQRMRCDRDAAPVAPGTYARLVRAMDAELHEASGKQELVLGDFAGFAHGSDKSESIREFVAALPDDVACSGVAWATHGYADPERPGGRPKADPVGELKRALHRRPCTRDAEIRVTETGAGGAHAGDDRDASPKALQAACRAIWSQLAAWRGDPRVAAAFQYTFRDDPAFPVGLADPGLQRVFPAYDVWKAWGGAERKPADPAPKLPQSCLG
jgi:hypothetical protein